MSLKARLKRLEQRITSPRCWFSLETWKAEHQEGISLDEQARRRLAEHPEHSEEIRASFARRRARLSEVAEIESDEQTEVQ